MPDPAFINELARQIKRHPESYPSWFMVLLEDMREASENVDRRERLTLREDDKARAFFAAT